MKKSKLSIIILSYNTKQLLEDCLDSLEKVSGEVDFEVIVSDNGSTDGSLEVVSKRFPWVKVQDNGENLGFAKGNNMARSRAVGKFILFLNSDTIVKPGTLSRTVGYLENNENVGAVTCKIVLPDESLDKDARRSFPTPWVSFTHLSGIDRLFPKSELFSKYWYGYKSAEETQEIDVLQGAYFLTRKKVLDSVGWFSEEYFLDGEDIDLCWKIKEKGWKIIYYPVVSIMHIKGASKGKVKRSFGKVTKTERIKFVNAGLISMEIFYRKFLWQKYPIILNWLIILGINLLKSLRYIKALIS